VLVSQVEQDSQVELVKSHQVELMLELKI
jgi:hypothetical protein